MNAAQVRRCAWHAHLPEDPAIDANLRRWVCAEGSLTARLVAASDRFRVRRLAQHMELALPDEWQALGLPAQRRALAREVLLLCDGTPAIFAHTVVKAEHARRDWPFLRGLGERPLGGALFVDPRVRREPFAFARLRAHHPLRLRLQQAVPAMRELDPGAALPARRSVFRRGGGVMLVTEVFLPDLLARRAPELAGKR
ncbi:chorismate lyase [Cupriavidus sp. 2TAF22]|uniref:chorismate--pyruvate lyase family protein n=1 Tax=unclassified Cupriavidus TaxID=2640874 RepID=UPI003F9283F8